MNIHAETLSNKIPLNLKLEVDLQLMESTLANHGFKRPADAHGTLILEQLARYEHVALRRVLTHKGNGTVEIFVGIPDAYLSRIDSETSLGSDPQTRKERFLDGSVRGFERQLREDYLGPEYFDP